MVPMCNSQDRGKTERRKVLKSKTAFLQNRTIAPVTRLAEASRGCTRFSQGYIQLQPHTQKVKPEGLKTRADQKTDLGYVALG